MSDDDDPIRVGPGVCRKCGRDGVILKHLGSCSVEPIDEWLDRYLGSIVAVAREEETHHREHHRREEAVRDFGRRVERLCKSVVNYDTMRLGAPEQDASRAFAEVRALLTDVRSAARELARLIARFGT